MTPDRHTQCDAFLEKLDAWLAGEYAGIEMQAHHDGCAACRSETRLAREIGSITSALPLLRGPEIPAPATANAAPGGLIAQLLAAWRQPLVFVPALAALVALVALPQLHTPDSTAVEPELVIIDGEEYTREEIRKATTDLQLALRYIDKYRPARVISAELATDDEVPAPPDADSTPAADEPTI